MLLGNNFAVPCSDNKTPRTLNLNRRECKRRRLPPTRINSREWLVSFLSVTLILCHFSTFLCSFFFLFFYIFSKKKNPTYFKHVTKNQSVVCNIQHKLHLKTIPDQYNWKEATGALKIKETIKIGTMVVASPSSSSSAEAEGATPPTERVKGNLATKGFSPLKTGCVRFSQSQGWTQSCQLLLGFFILRRKTSVYSSVRQAASFP